MKENNAPPEGEKKLCENCAHLTRLYRKFRYTYREAVPERFCGNYDILKSKRKKFNKITDCEYWQPRKIRIKKRRQSLAKEILKVCETLKEIFESVISEDE